MKDTNRNIDFFENEDLPIAIKKINKQWFSIQKKATTEHSIQLVEDINTFLLQSSNFIKVNNRNYIHRQLLHEEKFLNTVDDKQKKILFIARLGVKYIPYIKATINKDYGFLKEMGNDPELLLDSKLKSINFNDVLYIIRDGIYSHIHYKNGHVDKTYKTLNHFLVLNTFTKARRNILINLMHIDTFCYGDAKRQSEIIVNGERIKISRRLFKFFLKQYCEINKL